MIPPAPKRQCRPWTLDDIETLCSLTGDLPWAMVPAAFNRTRPPRSSAAIRIKIERLGISRRTVGQFITTGAIKEITGFSYQRIRRWIDKGELAAQKYGDSGNPYYISRRNLRKFARNYPERFGGLDESTLVQLFDSQRLAAKIVSMELPAWKKCVEVECVETGEKFKSITAAAKSAYVVETRIYKVLITGGCVNGLHYRRVSKAAKQDLR